MTEPQTPFVHQDGSTTPPRSKPALDPTLLGSSRKVLHAISLAIVGRERKVRGGNASLLLQARAVDRAAEGLELLAQPSINTVVATMTSLDPTMQALMADVVLALGNAGPGRQNLAIALRKLIEGRS